MPTLSGLRCTKGPLGSFAVLVDAMRLLDSESAGAQQNLLQRRHMFQLPLTAATLPGTSRRHRAFLNTTVLVWSYVWSYKYCLVFGVARPLTKRPANSPVLVRTHVHVQYTEVKTHAQCKAQAGRASITRKAHTQHTKHIQSRAGTQGSFSNERTFAWTWPWRTTSQSTPVPPDTAEQRHLIC